MQRDEASTEQEHDPIAYEIEVMEEIMADYDRIHRAVFQPRGIAPHRGAAIWLLARIDAALERLHEEPPSEPWQA